MSKGTRFCSECGADISDKGPGAKTCSDKHRKQRSQRLRAIAKRQRDLEDNPTDDAITGRIPAEIDEAINPVVQEELRPVVREALNEDTLHAIQKLVNLTGSAVEALAKQMESDDEKISQAAAKTVLQYTVGHPALVQKEEDSGTGNLVVNFALPRPAEQDIEITPPAEPEEGVITDAEVVQQCDMCHEEKPMGEFVAGSYRCQECFDKEQAKAAEILNGS